MIENNNKIEEPSRIKEMPNKVRTAKIVIQIQAVWSFLLAILLFVGFIYLATLKNFPRQDNAVFQLTILVIVIILSIIIGGIINLLVARGIVKQRKWARIVGIIFGASSVFGIPIGTVFGILMLRGLLSSEAPSWFNIKLIKITEMPNKIRWTKIMLFISGGFYILGFLLFILIIGIFYFLSASRGVYGMSLESFNLSTVLLIIIGIVIFLSTIGAIFISIHGIKKRKNWSRILTFILIPFVLYTPVPLLSGIGGLALAIGIIYCLLNNEADSWFVAS